MDEAFQERSVDEVAALVARRTGLGFADVRRKTFVEIVAAEIARLRVSGPERLLEVLDSSPAAFGNFVERLTVAESYFFRGPEQFDVVRAEVLPEIFRRCGTAHEPRLLSAGCAAGEEPYSLAIVLEEEALGDRSSVLGADVTRSSLARAAQATYGEWSLRGMSEAMRSRYFVRASGGWRLVERLRRRVELTWMNLADSSCPPATSARFDVIFCRNVLIYFTPEAIATVARRLFAMLGDGGWLFTAPSDPLLDGYAPFQVVIRPTGIVYRRPAGGTGMVTGDVLSAVPAPARADSARRAATAPHASPIVSAPSPADEARRADPVARAQELGNRGRVAEALAAAEEAVRQQPSSAEAHYLHALLLAEAGRERDAAATFRRALYFRGDFALAALGLGLTLSRLGDVAAARRALLRARSIVGRLPPDEPVACGEGERAGGVLSTIDVQLACLEERR